eukprot:s1454_g12.t1
MHQVPPGFRQKIDIDLDNYWCPKDTQPGEHCHSQLGFGDCPLCKHHREFVNFEHNFYKDILPNSFGKVLQEDLFLYSFDVYNDIDFEYHLSLAKKELPFKQDSLWIDQFTLTDWKHYITAFPIIDERVEEFLPIPRSYKLDFKLPDFTGDRPDCINSGYPLDIPQVHEHYPILSWFNNRSASHISYHSETYEDKWEITLCSSNPGRVNMIPWDHLIVVSAIIAIDEALDSKLSDLRPQGLDSEFALLIEQAAPGALAALIPSNAYRDTRRQNRQEYRKFLQSTLGWRGTFTRPVGPLFKVQ